jgi:phospholipase C
VVVGLGQPDQPSELGAHTLGAGLCLAPAPANHATRSIQDIEHIVVLMQENRSFDHYFGVMRGVRGFGDPHPVTLPNGKPVWYQADGATVVPPFRPDVGNLALTFIEDLDHSWNGIHQMFNGGN